MKIRSIDAFVVGNRWKNWLLVKVRTTEGHTGWGEATTGLSTLPAKAAVEEIARLFLGRHVGALTEAWQFAYKALYLTEDHSLLAALAGIETACLDILARDLGVSLHRVLGPKARDSIRAYANGWYQGAREPAVFAERAAIAAAKGYTALKFDPLGHNYRTLDRAERSKTIALVAAVRAALPDSVDMILEFHDRLTVTEAVSLANDLAEFRPLWIEDPVWSADTDALATVAARSPVRIAGGERLSSPNNFARLFARGSGIDLVLPEYLSLGGLMRMRDVAAVADANGALVAPHNAQSPLSTALNVHFDVAVPNAFIQECFDDFQGDWVKDIFTGYPVPANGVLAPSEAPGHGVDINESAISRYPYASVNFMNMFVNGWEKRNQEAAD